MTKAEEMKIIDKIEALINSTGEDSYTSDTFKGVCDLARKNIEWDAAMVPNGGWEQDAIRARKDAEDAWHEVDRYRNEYDRKAESLRAALEAAAAELDKLTTSCLDRAAEAAAAHDLDRLQELTRQAAEIGAAARNARTAANA